MAATFGISNQTLQDCSSSKGSIYGMYVSCVCVLRVLGWRLLCVRFSLAGSNSQAVSNELCSTYCLCFTREITLWGSSSSSPSNMTLHHLSSSLSAPPPEPQCLLLCFSATLAGVKFRCSVRQFTQNRASET